MRLHEEAGSQLTELGSSPGELRPRLASPHTGPAIRLPANFLDPS
jgi:hypothetical protein